MDRESARCDDHLPRLQRGNPAYFKFCGVCGSAMLRSEGESHETLMYASSPAIELVLIHPDGSEGEIFSDKDEVVIGRERKPVFSGSVSVTATRNLSDSSGALSVMTRKLNGTFVRIQREVEVHPGDRFRVGQQLLRFELADRTEKIIHPPQDGTLSPTLQMKSLGASCSCSGRGPMDCLVSKNTNNLLRSRAGTIIFADDGFMSGSHCRIVQRQGSCVLSDLAVPMGLMLPERVDLDEGEMCFSASSYFELHT